MKENGFWQSCQNMAGIATELTSPRATHKKWLGIYRLPLHSRYRMKLQDEGKIAHGDDRASAYRIRIFETHLDKIAEDRWLAESDLENTEDYFAVGDDDLFDVLAKLNVDIAKLNLGYGIGYPI